MVWAGEWPNGWAGRDRPPVLRNTGQPGLIGWFGELLTETYNKHNPTITMRDFEITFAAAVDALPNNNILNIISKARQETLQAIVAGDVQNRSENRFQIWR